MIQEFLYQQQFPVFDLGDIILRELTDYDAKDYLDYMSRSEMKAFLAESNRPLTIEQALDEVRYWGNLFRNQRSFYWAIALKDTNKLIGTAGFNTISQTHFKAEISYDLDFIFWGKGIMLKSIKTILKFADHIGIKRTQATVINDNTRSINVLERCNFVKEGILKNYEVIQGKSRDYLMYARVLSSPNEI